MDSELVYQPSNAERMKTLLLLYNAQRTFFFVKFVKDEKPCQFSLKSCVVNKYKITQPL